MVLAVFQYLFSRKVHGSNVFDMKYIVVLSVALFGGAMLCMLLYPFIWARYAVIVIMLVLAVVFRKKIMALFTTMKKKEG